MPDGSFLQRFVKFSAYSDMIDHLFAAFFKVVVACIGCPGIVISLKNWGDNYADTGGESVIDSDAIMQFSQELFPVVSDDRLIPTGNNRAARQKKSLTISLLSDGTANARA